MIFGFDFLLILCFCFISCVCVLLYICNCNFFLFFWGVFFLGNLICFVLVFILILECFSFNDGESRGGGKGYVFFGGE